MADSGCYWQWDAVRQSYYHWDHLEECYVYEDGTELLASGEIKRDGQTRCVGIDPHYG